MSNLEEHPIELDCSSDAGVATDADALHMEVLTARDVPLGGPRAMTVRRTLPQRSRSLIGAWCFIDHYGPDDVAARGGMDVPPHPHTGLQTVSWLFTGEVEHRDTMGNHAMVRPGEINLMTAGHGIAHTEVSTAQATMLHGVQLWTALPAAHADTPRDFAHHRPLDVVMGGVTAKVFLGELFGSRSPVDTFTPLLGAQLDFAAGASIDIDVEPTYEHGILVDAGTIAVAGTGAAPLARTELGYLGLGAQRLTLTNIDDAPARVILLGGTPLGEDIVMWWNFIGRTHDEIVAFRDQWMAHSDRFGQVAGYDGDIQHLPAPELPRTRLRPRTNTPGHA
ncbi:pirin family protein [Gordonia jinghuaiqii]|uniref:Pirin family protein n=1 Tax=Gordonia jinghuaiqii TaxID=2758710 RepID=A0A7D7QYZ4_9ACTN|nr:pirin family protein [Gordonia jinghuaiqii]MCR5979490.1 pirin family protein [Gordonia jinghuaiqii]QMT00711.1 pirin family protein [Gordonia jinghuaiqii]